MQIIDSFNHISPPKFNEALSAASNTKAKPAARPVYGMESMSNIDTRLRIMDRFDGYYQILNISLPAIEDTVGPEAAVDLAKIANDEMAELVYKYPERFLGAMACLPMNNINAALKELDRAIFQLGFKGVQITTTVNDKPLDSPEFDPFFEKMNKYELPIQIHPRHVTGYLDTVLGDSNDTGWPIDTTLCMNRLVYSGLLCKYPNLKILTHHCGGVTPYVGARIFRGPANPRVRLKQEADNMGFSKTIEDYYKMFYADTAMWGWTPGLMCGCAFFGVDHILFGTDYPYGPRGGEMFIRDTIRSVQEMAIPEEDKKKIFELNARKLFKIPI
jgi:predicted TIM-barrel fold metal-dependent hydrolase